MDTGGGGSLMSKRILIEISHAIEQFALAAEPGEPLLVVALFQRASYFARELEVYRRIAGRGAVVLIGLAEDLPPELPAGVRHRLLGPDDPLAREWSVTVLGPHGGATLVAIDQETVAADAATIEQGRQFRGRWSFHRDDAYREAVRLRTQLRLPVEAVAAVDHVLRSVVAEPEPPRQTWWDGPLRFLAARVEQTLRSRDRARAALDAAQASPAERDPRTGLLTPAYLARWTAGLGAGTLPIGLLALRVLDVEAVRERYGVRAEMAALMAVARVLQARTTGSDRLVRVGRGDFLFVLPGRRPDEVVDLARLLSADTARLEEQFPFVALDTALTGTVTRRRPLPIARLLDELDRSVPRQDGVRLLVG